MQCRDGDRRALVERDGQILRPFADCRRRTLPLEVSRGDVAARPGAIVASQFATSSGIQHALEVPWGPPVLIRSEEHTSELQSLMRLSYAVLCFKKQTTETH